MCEAMGASRAGGDRRRASTQEGQPDAQAKNTGTKIIAAKHLQPLSRVERGVVPRINGRVGLKVGGGAAAPGLHCGDAVVLPQVEGDLARTERWAGQRTESGG